MDYETGSGTSRFKLDVLSQWPQLGLPGGIPLARKLPLAFPLPLRAPSNFTSPMLVLLRGYKIPPTCQLSVRRCSAFPVERAECGAMARET